MENDSIHVGIIQLIHDGSMALEPARLSLLTEPALLGMFRDSRAKRSLVPAAVDGFPSLRCSIHLLVHILATYLPMRC